MNIYIYIYRIYKVNNLGCQAVSDVDIQTNTQSRQVIFINLKKCGWKKNLADSAFAR